MFEYADSLSSKYIGVLYVRFGQGMSTGFILYFKVIL